MRACFTLSVAHHLPSDCAMCLYAFSSHPAKCGRSITTPTILTQDPKPICSKP